MEFIEVSAKTVNDAITEACRKLSVTSDRLHYEVIEEGSNGFLGIGAKPALIKAAVKEEMTAAAVEKNNVSEKKVVSEKKAVSANTVSSNGKDLAEVAKTFLKDVFAAMNIEAAIVVTYNEEDKSMDIDMSGDEMGIIIGKRGQTLDSLQYLVSLVVNKESADYIRVKVDTENYRQRRKETLENLAKNIAYKVKRTRRSVTLEPMNPYERRIIHSALQNDKYVTTHSEGEEPFRKVVVTLKR